MIGRRGPFGQINYEPKEIIELVRRIPDTQDDIFRPDIQCIYDSGNCADYIVNCIRDGWDENPDIRPDFPAIR